MSDTEELKPCPCGRPLLLRKTAWGVLYVMGEGCCSTEFSEKFDRHAIISACNKRAVPPPGVETEGHAKIIETCVKICTDMGAERHKVYAESEIESVSNRAYTAYDAYLNAATAIRALLSTSSRGEDLSSRDKRASSPASNGRPPVAEFKTEAFGARVANILTDTDQIVEVQDMRDGTFHLIVHRLIEGKDYFEDMTAVLKPDHFRMLGSVAGAPVGSQASE